MVIGDGVRFGLLLRPDEPEAYLVADSSESVKEVPE